MIKSLGDTMGHALAATRAGNLSEATRLIQSGLSGAAPAQPQRDVVSTSPRLNGSKINRDAETIEPQAAPHSKWRSPFQEMPGIFGRNAAVPQPLSEGAQIESRTGTSEAGSRNYRLYIPSNTPKGLIVMLHGCSQSADDFAIGTGMNAVAEQFDLLVAYPEQTRSANANGCWNWFEPAHQGRGMGEPEIIAEITRTLLAEFSVKEAMVAGLSAGGAMAGVLAETYPELFSAVGVHSGLATGSSSDMGSAFAAMQGRSGVLTRTEQVVPTLIVHGTSDTTVHHSNATRIVESFGVATETAQTEQFSAGGRTVTRSIYRAGSIELWSVEGAGHAWSGGQAGGSYTDASGPDASAEMVRFFLAARTL